VVDAPSEGVAACRAYEVALAGERRLAKGRLGKSFMGPRPAFIRSPGRPFPMVALPAPVAHRSAIRPSTPFANRAGFGISRDLSA
jgi:hypothetical protein